MPTEQVIERLWEATPEATIEFVKTKALLAAKGKETLRRFYDDPVAWATHCIDWPEGQSLTDYQRDVLAAIPIHSRVAQRGPHGLGKALATTTPIPTPDGWMTMGQLRVGDQVVDEQGRPCNVVSVSERWWGDTWLVVFSDGSEVVTHGNHEWNAIDVYDRPKGVADWRDHWDVTKVRTTRQIADTLASPGGQLRWRIPTARPLDLPPADLPIDPYVLGVWLGDGHSAGAQITSADQGIVDEVIAAGEYCRKTSAPYAWSLSSGGSDRGPTGFRVRLRALNLLGNKHIPMAYLRASESQRWALLQGLMDTDGFRMDGNLVGFDLCDKRLAADAVELVHSLGFTTKVHESDATFDGRIVGCRWRVNFRPDDCPFRLARKREGWQHRGAQSSRHTQRTIVSVERVEDAETVCIEVDSPSHLFLCGEAMIPTHNSTTSAIAVLWFATTREAAGIDWKCITTAGGWHQLEHYLWPEIHKWARLIKWKMLGREPFNTRTELMKLKLSLSYGEAFAVASSDPARIEGAHADSILYIYDESKVITNETFDAAEGAFSGAGHDGREAFALASSTPGEPVGRFYDIHQHKEGFEDWWTRHVTLQEAVAAGRVGEEWAKQRARQWGAESQLYYNRVLGEFHSSDEDSVIPLAWIELAQQRWLDNAAKERAPMDRIGLDVAGSGEDKTVFAPIHGLRVEQLQYLTHEDTEQIADRAIRKAAENPGVVIVVDSDGLGVGVFDKLNHADNVNVIPFHAGAKSDKKDKSGELTFADTRSAAWWSLREMLDPMEGSTIELPNDDLLTGDLSAPKWQDVNAKGVIKVEQKKEIKKRLGRSTDSGDAVVMGLWRPRTKKRARMAFAGRAA